MKSGLLAAIEALRQYGRGFSQSFQFIDGLLDAFSEDCVFEALPHLLAIYRGKGTFVIHYTPPLRACPRTVPSRSPDLAWHHIGDALHLRPSTPRQPCDIPANTQLHFGSFRLHGGSPHSQRQTDSLTIRIGSSWFTPWFQLHV
jgi:hypothetical protein